MASKVEIANRALISIGASTIMAFSDRVREARAVAAIWDTARLAVLREHIWKFARKRVTLAPLVAAPVYEYSAAFQLPSDWVRMVSIYGNPEYRVNGTTLLCNESELDIEYIYDTGDNTGIWDDLATTALSAKLAEDICMKITQDADLTAEKKKDYIKALRRAKSMDAKDQPYLELASEDWLAARLSSSTTDIPRVSM